MDEHGTLDRRGFLAALAGLSSAPLLAACAGRAPDDAAAGAAGPELSTLRVGTLPIVGAAPLTLAVEEGLFTAGGLTVAPEPVQSGAIALPALVAGDLDVLFSNHVSTIAARAQNLDVMIIAEGSRALPGNFGIVALPDSPVRGPADLAGRTLGINALNNVADLTTRAVLTAEGVAAEQVSFVEIPFPDMTNALVNGRVDAAFLPEPFLAEALRTLSLTTVLDPLSGPTDGLPVDGYIVTGGFAEQNPGTVRAFRGALREAQRRCADRTVLEPLLVSSARVDPATAPQVSASEYPTDSDPAEIQRVADLMLRFGAIAQPVDVAEMVVPA